VLEIFVILIAKTFTISVQDAGMLVEGKAVVNEISRLSVEQEIQLWYI